MTNGIKKNSLGCFLAICLLPFPAYAAGFYLQEASIKGLGYAFSGSATSLDDASTIYFNPAGMTRLESAQINIGAHILFPSARVKNTGSTFDFNGPAPGGIGPITGGNGGNPYSPTPLPNLFMAAPVTGGLWAGIGVTTPFGLANEYNEGWFGRYDSTKTALQTINIQPSLAYRATDWLSIGGGIDIQYADAKLERAASNIASEGTSTLKGDDWTIGYNIGVQITPQHGTHIGMHYRSAISHQLDGRIMLQGLNAGNFNVTGGASLDLPDIATFGIARDITPRVRLMAQAIWFGWNNYDEIQPVRDDGVATAPTLQNYKTTWAFALGGEYDINDQWTLRAGYQFDETPTTNLYRTSRTPDGDRNWITAGASYQWTPDLSLDLAAAYIHVSDEKINVSRNNGLAAIRADTEGSVGIFALGLTYKF